MQEQYKAKLAQYEAKLSEALAKNDASALPEIRKLNQETSALLSQVLTEMAGNPQALRTQREELVTTLNRIERDYAGLSKSADTLEQLRRIREGQTGVVQQTFNWYLFLFILACVGILFMALFVPQNMFATATSAAMPATTAPLV